LKKTVSDRVCDFAGFSLSGFGLGEAAEDLGPLLEVVTVVLYL
jgi:hypothetical protein